MARMLRPTMIACNYFDRDFNVNNYKRCKDMVPKELIESSQISLLRMLKSQRMSSVVLVIFYAFVGRLLGEIRNDNWEKLFYVVGQAGSGKSTLLKSIVAKFYAEHDVCNTVSDT
jgi:AAA15 family ATPase/GTPase